jgi:signal peptide peptidase-like protein 2B
LRRDETKEKNVSRAVRTKWTRTSRPTMHRRHLFLDALYLLLLARLAAQVQASPWALPSTVLTIAPAPASPSQTAVTLFVSESSGSLPAREEALAAALVMRTPDAAERDGCEEWTALARPWVAVVERGGRCLLAAKALRAVEAGASAVIIVNMRAALYNTSTLRLLNPCWTNCERASAATQSECEAAVPICAQSPVSGAPAWCAVEDNLIRMYLGEVPVEIPVVFASIADGPTLVRAALHGASCAMFERPTYAVDPSVFILASIGVLAVAVASHRAARTDRSKFKGLAPGAVPEPRVAEFEHLDLTAWAVAGFLFSTTMALLVLFAIIQFAPFLVVWLVQVLFVFGAAGALAQLVFEPLAERFASPEWSRAVIHVAGLGLVSKADVFSFLAGSAVSWTWFACRHAMWSWVLLDLLALAMACSFLLAIRLPSLKIGALLLCAFFVYDIFMVFVTPMLAGGRSVMVDVATAGRCVLWRAGGQTAASSPPHVRGVRVRRGSEKPVAGICVRRVSEHLPMLFMVPRFDWFGGSSMLGLGDVVIPGLVIVLGLRVDYANRTSSCRPDQSYWTALCAAYALGLAMTFAANINNWTFGTGVRGQPALMYLVPSILSCFLALAWRRGQVQAVWTGSLLEEPATVVAEAAPGAATEPSSLGLGEQHEPLL